ncbi:type II toxin-antitoxin system Phd/YefM family antitoxin [Leucobacter viscericola]|uniref:Antitoxin n=1 Tax=Leucobacter viscericola TaxID=2714935 RepID=A0A6G7XDQ1_9MICO|nr:type II toxin-antitoxin system Phd/YefM family antitoxin [Leucobacter viscericola]QIK62632.1 type II toxin-antitoxin system Phd/YefM family antitoxin [Leucobacter viscericola]
MSLTLPVSVAKQQLGSLVDRAHLANEDVYLTKHGHKFAVLVDAAKFEQMLEELEDFQDAEAARRARKEMEATGAAPIPWEEVKADLGLA